ncbi:hypothetical protein NPIL_449681, partial [Nephila pilipes]
SFQEKLTAVIEACSENFN